MEEEDSDGPIFTQELDETMMVLREDICEWLSKVLDFPSPVKPEEMMSALDNGVMLCRLACLIHNAALETRPHELSYIFTNCNSRRGSIQTFCGEHQYSHPASITGPVTWEDAKRIKRIRTQATSGNWFSRDNISMFLEWCRERKIRDEVLFVTEGLVSHGEEKNVILTLLELARLGGRYGLPVPRVVTLEREIDRSWRSCSFSDDSSSVKSSSLTETLEEMSSELSFDAHQDSGIGCEADVSADQEDVLDDAGDKENVAEVVEEKLQDENDNVNVTKAIGGMPTKDVTGDVAADNPQVINDLPSETDDENVGKVQEIHQETIDSSFSDREQQQYDAEKNNDDIKDENSEVPVSAGEPADENDSQSAVDENKTACEDSDQLVDTANDDSDKLEDEAIGTAEVLEDAEDQLLDSETKSSEAEKLKHELENPNSLAEDSKDVLEDKSPQEDTKDELVEDLEDEPQEGTKDDLVEDLEDKASQEGTKDELVEDLEDEPQEGTKDELVEDLEDEPPQEGTKDELVEDLEDEPPQEGTKNDLVEDLADTSNKDLQNKEHVQNLDDNPDLKNGNFNASYEIGDVNDQDKNDTNSEDLNSTANDNSEDSLMKDTKISEENGHAINQNAEIAICPPDNDISEENTQFQEQRHVEKDELYGSETTSNDFEFENRNDDNKVEELTDEDDANDKEIENILTNIDHTKVNDEESHVKIETETSKPLRAGPAKRRVKLNRALLELKPPTDWEKVERELAEKEHVPTPDELEIDRKVSQYTCSCTCEPQFQAVKLRACTYKIGGRVCFLRLLRGYVMVRVGGGWSTLAEYLRRHDPCRVQKFPGTGPQGYNLVMQGRYKSKIRDLTY